MKRLHVPVCLLILAFLASCASPAPSGPSPEPAKGQPMELVRVSMPLVSVPDPTPSAKLAFDNMGVPSGFSWFVDRAWAKQGQKVDLFSAASFDLSMKQRGAARSWGETDLVTMSADVERPRRTGGRMVTFRVGLGRLSLDPRKADSLAAAAVRACLAGQADGQGWLRLESMSLQGDEVLIQLRLGD